MNTLSEARRWHNLGISTIPIRAQSKAPAIDSWRPYQTRLPTLRELDIWFGSDRYGLAVVTGHQGLAVIDFDDEWRFSRWLASLESGIAGSVLSTYRVRTRRGWHFYFYCDEPAECWAGDGVDVKGGGGYVLAPPSVHPSGHRYEAIGQPEQIVEIAKIGDLLPRYAARPSWQAARREVRERDPFADAMRAHDPTGTSIEEIKQRWTFEDLLSENGNGKRVWHARCPLHNDNHASLAVYSDEGRAFCFGCRWAGDVINLYAEIHGLSIAEAMREMA